jgi:1-acyl-sn-glycerol-3-phosphate acyltransferase
MFNRIRGALRLLQFGLHCARYTIVVYSISKWGGKDKVATGLRARRRWAHGMLRILRFKVQWEGDIPEGETCLFVGNHRSSLDPIIIMSKVIVYPVSRADVRHWPIVGKGSEITGVIFVDKANRASRTRTKELILNTLNDGNSVLIFPEGRTNVDPTTTTFQKGAFDQAAAGGFRVVPFMIEYKDKEDNWDHTDSFAVHFIKRFGKRRTHIRIIFGEPLRSDNAWTLLRGAQSWIDDRIAEVRREWDEE